MQPQISPDLSRRFVSLLTSDGMLLLIVVSGQAPHVAHVGLAVVVVLEPLAVADQGLPLGRRLHVVAAAAATVSLAACVLVIGVDPVGVVAGDVDEVAVHPLVARPERRRVFRAVIKP